MRKATQLFVALACFSGLQAEDGAESSNAFIDFFQTGLSRVDIETDGLMSDDVNVYRSAVSYQIVSGKWTIGGTAGQTRHDIDYNPNVTTNPSERDERTQDYSLSIEREWSDSVSVSLSGSYYNGFTDFRSLWISEFFRQSFQDFPQYREADPQGFSVGLGTVYTFANGVDTLSVDLGFARDRIAPGWEIGGPRFNEAESTNDRLETISGSVELENVITRSLKTRQTVRLSEVTNRQLRVQYQTDWAWRFAPQFVLRAELGGAYERPDFEAYFGSANVVYEVNEQLQLSLGFRLYSDTGEITSSNFNTAAPGFDSDELSISVRWTNGQIAARASVGFYDTHFDESQIENISFANLYSDREFIAFRLAVSSEF